MLKTLVTTQPTRSGDDKEHHLTARQFRQLVWVLAAAVILVIIARRWRAFAGSTPAITQSSADWLVTAARTTTPVLTENIVSTDADQQENEQAQLQPRKVSKDRRIRFCGQRYGPLPETLIGQQVWVEEIDEQLQITFDGERVAIFRIAAR